METTAEAATALECGHRGPSGLGAHARTLGVGRTAVQCGLGTRATDVTFFISVLSSVVFVLINDVGIAGSSLILRACAFLPPSRGWAQQNLP